MRNKASVLVKKKKSPPHHVLTQIPLPPVNLDREARVTVVIVVCGMGRGAMKGREDDTD